MDNVIVGITGLVCFATAEVSTGWFESLTPLGIVALVVYYFLYKFDKKLESIDHQTAEIKEAVERLAEDAEDEE